MIVWHNTEPFRIYWNGDMIEVNAETYEVWTAFLSCFGRGYWIDELPWVDTDVWVD